MILRIEDIDVQRCKPQYLQDMIEDLQWFGIPWTKGYRAPSNTPQDNLNYVQSKRFIFYEAAWKILYEKGYIYPCKHSRKDVEHALSAPHDIINHQRPITKSTNPLMESSNEIIFPTMLRPSYIQETSYGIGHNQHYPQEYQHLQTPYDIKVNWRFRIPDDYQPIGFEDSLIGYQSFIPGQDFGDFLIWRLDGFPSYELAVVVDDILMNITEVVRGQDLLLSTVRQLLVMNALFDLDWRKESHWHALPGEVKNSLDDISLKESSTVDNSPEGNPTEDNPTEDNPTDNNSLQGIQIPQSKEEILSILSKHSSYHIPRYFHAPLVCDEHGIRLAKRNLAKSIRMMREEGRQPMDIQSQYFQTAYDRISHLI